MADAVLAVLIFAPVLITFVLKSNAAVSYLVLCGSFALISFGNTDIQNLTGQLNFKIDSNTINLILLISPLFLTLMLTGRSFSGQIRMALHLLTALCAGGLLALISIPLLNSSLRTDFSNNWAWTDLQNAQAPIVAAGLVLSLVLIWFSHHPKHAKRHKHHK